MYFMNFIIMQLLISNVVVNIRSTTQSRSGYKLYKLILVKSAIPRKVHVTEFKFGPHISYKTLYKLLELQKST